MSSVLGTCCFIPWYCRISGVEGSDDMENFIMAQRELRENPLCCYQVLQVAF